MDFSHASVNTRGKTRWFSGTVELAEISKRSSNKSKKLQLAECEMMKNVGYAQNESDRHYFLGLTRMKCWGASIRRWVSVDVERWAIPHEDDRVVRIFSCSIILFYHSNHRPVHNTLKDNVQYFHKIKCANRDQVSRESFTKNVAFVMNNYERTTTLVFGKLMQWSFVKSEWLLQTLRSDGVVMLM